MKVSNLLLLCGWVMTSAVAAGPSQAPAQQVSEGVSAVGGGSMTVVRGSANALVGAGKLVITGVESSGDAVVLTVGKIGSDLSQVGEISLRGTREAVGKTSFAVGESVVVTFVAAGVVLSCGGQVLAFLPNEIGHQLLHREKLG